MDVNNILGVSYSGASKPYLGSGDDAFCVIGNVWGKLKDAVTMCVFETRIDASKIKMRLRPGLAPAGLAGGAYNAPVDLLAGFERKKG